MKWRIFAAIALTASAALAERAHAQRPPDVPAARGSGGRGSISGVVTRWPSGEPAAGAIVKLVEEPPGASPPGAQAQAATTGADGSFRFDNVEARPWWVVANLQGYLPAEYGQRSPTGTGISVDVATGRRVNVRLTMWPTSGISGRVVDADGDPAVRVQVLALRTVYRAGKPSMTIVQTVTTNDRGEYRMFWLTPGSYRIAARQFDTENSTLAVNIGPPRRFGTNELGTSPIVTRRRVAGGSVVEEIDVAIYAPSTADPQLASVTTLAPGDTATAVDIQLVGNRVRARHVRGVYVGSEEFGRPPHVLLVPRAELPFAIVATGVVKNDLTFDIPGVAPGSYLLFSGDSHAVQPIEVGDADVDNVILTGQFGISLKGRLSFDRGLSSASADVRGVNPQDFQIRMTRDPFLVGAPDGGPRFNPAAGDNGAINLTLVSPGDYRLAVGPLGISPDVESLAGRRPSSGPARNAYLKSIRLGDADILADGLHLSGPTSQQLDIVIGLNGAEAEGTVSDGREPASNVVIIAVPEGGNRRRQDLYKRASTDAQGRFAMTGLVPGDYSFYAWDDVEAGAWENPDFMRVFEGRGRFVRLHEGRNDALELIAARGR